MLEEGFGSVMQSVGNGIRAVIKYILDALQKFWSWFSKKWNEFFDNLQKVEKDLDDNARAIAEARKKYEEVKHVFERNGTSREAPADHADTSHLRETIRKLKNACGATRKLDLDDTRTLDQKLGDREVTIFSVNFKLLDDGFPYILDAAATDSLSENDVAEWKAWLSSPGHSKAPRTAWHLDNLLGSDNNGLRSGALDSLFQEETCPVDFLKTGVGQGKSFFIQNYLDGKSEATLAATELKKYDEKFRHCISMQKNDSRADIIQYISNKWLALLAQSATAVKREAEIISFYQSTRAEHNALEIELVDHFMTGKPRR